MSFSGDLVTHAIRLLGNSPDALAKNPSSVDMRRAVSAAYYALFHHLSEAMVQQVAPQVSPDTANRVHRWLDHTEMKKICGEFAATRLRPPLNGLLGDVCSDEMQAVANAFIRLQQARHSADYDLAYQLSWSETREFIETAVTAIAAWERICPSSESNIFVLSLLLWKKWESARQ